MGVAYGRKQAKREGFDLDAMLDGDLQEPPRAGGDCSFLGPIIEYDGAYAIQNWQKQLRWKDCAVTWTRWGQKEYTNR